MRLFELAAHGQLAVVNADEHLEFTTVVKTNSMEASARLRRSDPSRLITWQIITAEL
jgi:hypothetical protein